MQQNWGKKCILVIGESIFFFQPSFHFIVHEVQILMHVADLQTPQEQATAPGCLQIHCTDHY